MISHPRKYENHKRPWPPLYELPTFCPATVMPCEIYVHKATLSPHEVEARFQGITTQAHAACVARLPPLAQKCQIRSLAAITAQFLVGAIPALALPLKARLSIER